MVLAHDGQVLTPEELLALVDGYARLGDHRTGTPVDRATLAWLSGVLTDLGATVGHDLWSFDQYQATCTATVNGSPVAAVPLWYSGTGHVVDDDPDVAVLNPTSASDLDGLQDATSRAVARGRSSLVVATVAPRGGLFAVNRAPGEARLPVVLVAGAVAPDLERGASVGVEIDAWLSPGFSSNLRACWGGAPDEPYALVTTPLTGWFGCAGERGTGIAIAVSLAAELAQQVPVLLLGTTGHELEGLGASHHLTLAHRPPNVVIHIGASAAAAGTKPGILSEGVQTVIFPPTAELLMTGRLAGHEVRGPDAGWRGEAALWSAYGVPQLSVAGGSPLFHTPDDRLPAATEARLLATVRDGLLATARQLVAGRNRLEPSVVRS